jgi:radical SAM protein with 4Fe4S-binding SPASM domain
MVDDFNYNYFEDFIKKLILTNDIPLQIELHTGDSCGPYNCPFCYGRLNNLPKEDRLEKEKWVELIDDVSDKVKNFLLAGIKSDPLSNKDIYEIIKRIKEKNTRVGIHTKGYYLNEKLSDLLNINTAYGDYITFSVDTSSSELYKKIHGINIKEDVFDTVYKNISYLYDRKKKTDSKLNITVSYLLFKNNYSLNNMEDFVIKFKDYSDKIRFSIPQLPNNFKETPPYYLSDDEVSEAESNYLKLKNKYRENNIVFLKFENNNHETDFKMCYAQKFLSVVDFTGNIYPCPQVASDRYNYLSYGSLKRDNFWKIWNSENRKNLLSTPVKTLDCRICDRKDEEINNKISKYFEK